MRNWHHLGSNEKLTTMKWTVLALFILATTVHLLSARQIPADLATLTATSLELYALDQGLPLQDHVAHITHCIFGRSEPGYQLFTQKIMRDICKSTQSMSGNYLAFYSHVLREFHCHAQHATSKKIVHKGIQPPPPQTPFIRIPAALKACGIVAAVLVILFVLSNQITLDENNQQLMRSNEQISTRMTQLQTTLEEAQQSIESTSQRLTAAESYIEQQQAAIIPARVTNSVRRVTTGTIQLAYTGASSMFSSLRSGFSLLRSTFSHEEEQQPEQPLPLLGLQQPEVTPLVTQPLDLAAFVAQPITEAEEPPAVVHANNNELIAIELVQERLPVPERERQTPPPRPITPEEKEDTSAREPLPALAPPPARHRSHRRSRKIPSPSPIPRIDGNIEGYIIRRASDHIQLPPDHPAAASVATLTINYKYEEFTATGARRQVPQQPYIPPRRSDTAQSGQTTTKGRPSGQRRK